jgi:nitrogen fixation NifU-like protein
MDTNINRGGVNPLEEILSNNTENIRELLANSGYADEAIMYFLNRTNMGMLSDADQVSELTGPCGDTMKIYLKMKEERIEDAKIQVLGCPGAVASAMAAMDLIKGKTLEEARSLKDRDIFRMLGDLPDQKQHCIRLTVKTLQKAIDEYTDKQDAEIEGE